ncbi:MAG TPA: class I SAM-dependent methyltransferase [Streptosporangiaceae bacterium]
MTTLRPPASVPSAAPDLLAAIAAWDQAAWNLAALALVAAGDGPPEMTAAAQQLVSVCGITAAPGQPVPGADTATAQQIASQAAAPLHQAAALATGRAISWSDQSDEALLAQGRASALGARFFAEVVLPAMGDLRGRVAAPGARMLDVGTGVGALAVAFAQVFPRLGVLGIDVLDRPLDLARQNIAASDVAARVTVRKQDVAGFTDDTGFELAFLPAPFVPPPAMHTGLPRVVAALRPRGWVFMAHGKFGGTPAEDSLTRLKTLVYGGTPLGEAEAFNLLRGAGLTSVRPVPTPEGAPGITIGQKSA